MNEPIPTREQCEQYFRDHGVRPEQGTRFWEHENSFHWRSKFPWRDAADRWIANAKPHERLRPDEFAPTCRLKPFPVPPPEPPDPDLIPMPESMRRRRPFA